MRGKHIKWSIVCLILGLLSGVLSYVYMRPQLPKDISFQKDDNIEPALVEDEKEVPFPGWQDRERKRPLAVMIDNAPGARPQSGLDKADLVVELPVEGGVTRFIAFISSEDIEMLGPIRSARTAFVDLAKEFNGILVHAGGSMDALEAIKNYKLNHLDEILGGSQVSTAFWRVPDRSKPHNLYASSDSLRKASEKMKYDNETASNYFSYLQEGETVTGKETNEITVFYTNRTCKASFLYDPEKLVFKRYTEEEPHLTEAGKEITAANVIVQFVPYLYLDGDGHMQLIMHGKGDALIFREGKVTKGYWEKDPGKVTKYKDSNGNTIPLVPGPTWIQVVKKGTRVDY